MYTTSVLVITPKKAVFETVHVPRQFLLFQSYLAKTCETLDQDNLQLWQASHFPKTATMTYQYWKLLGS